jgi:hypothetical protein
MTIFESIWDSPRKTVVKGPFACCWWLARLDFYTIYTFYMANIIPEIFAHFASLRLCVRKTAALD